MFYLCSSGRFLGRLRLVFACFFIALFAFLNKIFEKNGQTFWWFEKNAYLCIAIAKNAFATNAKIAQLVEHNLAKVGVAGSSPVFRSREQ